VPAPKGTQSPPHQKSINLVKSPMLLECGGSYFLLANGFRFYFTGITSLLFTFPSQYLFTIGEVEYLALASSLACFLQGFLPRAVLKKNIKEHKEIFKYGTITLCGFSFQSNSFNQSLFLNSSGLPRRYFLTTPYLQVDRVWARSLFARRY
jgi:hypothetical protein